jgi:hypothetical protein
MEMSRQKHRRLSRLSASQIADRAYESGERDNITVIILDWQSGELPTLAA